MRVLYDDVLRYRPAGAELAAARPLHPEQGPRLPRALRDAGRQGLLPARELETFCRRDSILGGHPEPARCRASRPRPARSATACRSASAWRSRRACSKRDSRVFVVMGDGEINEGSVWEAALCAGKHRLSNLVAIVDYNKIQSAGTDARDPGPRAARRQVARLRLRGRRGRRPRRRGAARRVRRACRSTPSKPTRDHLPYRQGQGRPVRRARSGLAPQVQDLAPRWSSSSTPRWSRADARRPASTWSTSSRKRDERVVFIGSDLSPGLLAGMKQGLCPTAGTWKASPRRT